MKSIIVIALALPAIAHTASPSPYAGEGTRQIKALSPSEQSDLLSGKGMGLAKAAELNGFPGPAHVLELASELGLSAEQLASTRLLFASMQHQAREIGRQLVDAEHSLDAQFASQQILTHQLEESLSTIGDLQGKVRAAHLKAHIEQAHILSDEQKATYARLRGYAQRGEQNDAPGHSHQH